MKPAYTVFWPRALVERTVAQVLLSAIEDGTGSAAVTSAMAEIDRQLSTLPMNAGEARDANERILFVPPIAVTYKVREADRVVSILRARYMRPRPH